MESDANKEGVGPISHREQSEGQEEVREWVLSNKRRE